jgi:hypothetical protein
VLRREADGARGGAAFATLPGLRSTCFLWIKGVVRLVLTVLFWLEETGDVLALVRSGRSGSGIVVLRLDGVTGAVMATGGRRRR